MNKRLSDEELMQILKVAMEEFRGDATVLESAIGALVFGREMGWQAIRLIHAGRTFKRYEDILRIKFREVLPERTKKSTRMRGIRIADTLGKFWQVVTAGMVKGREAAIVEGS